MRRNRFRPVATLASLVLLIPAQGCATEPPPVPQPWATVPATTWQWQLSGDLDLTVDAEVFALDAFTTPAAAVHQLRDRGRRVICYVNAGAYEHFRPDADRFPAEVLGASDGSPDRRWLDIRQWPVLEPILADRFRLCRGKGFQAVVPDNMDSYLKKTGFPLSYDDQLQFNRRLAALARSIGLSPGLKNDLPQVTALEPEFDFAVNEGCFRQRECDRLEPFVNRQKPVFHVEYDTPTADFCATTIGYGFASIRKDRGLGVWRAPCLR
jgi:hypothetical protein